MVEGVTITCSHCGAVGLNVTVTAPATITAAQMVEVDIDLAVDLAATNVHRDRWGNKRRYLTSFNLIDRLEMLDPDLDHHSLEVDDERLVAHCFACEGDVTEEWRTLMEGLLEDETPLECPTCRGGGVNWSETTVGSYGMACLQHRLFWTCDVQGDQSWSAIPLNMAPMPRAKRSVPAFREAADWTGPTS